MVPISSGPPPYPPGGWPPLPPQPGPPYYAPWTLPPQAGRPAPPKPIPNWVFPVAVALVLGAIAAAAVLPGLSGPAPLGPGPPPPPPTITLSSNGWSGPSSMATHSLTITSTTNVGGIGPAVLQYIVTTSGGTACYSGGQHENQTSCQGFAVNVAYDDNLDTGAVSPGDTIRITVTPNTGNPLIGGQLTVQTFDNRIMGRASL